MTASELVAKFTSVFAGRLDAIGTEEGGCDREPWRSDYWLQHLHGNRPIGIYPVVESSLPGHFLVKFGAIDIDYEDIQEAWNIHDLLKSVDINSWVERSRSKGYHVWVFVEDWMPAKTMRHALLVVRDFLKIKAREAYPKQVSLKAGELGNYIRIPYPGEDSGMLPYLQRSGNGAPKVLPEEPRRVMLHRDGTPYSLTQFLSSAELYAEPSAIETLASRYVEPKRVEVDPIFIGIDGDESAWSTAARAALHELGEPLLWHIVKHGPSDAQDRSSTLMRLANLAASYGATASQTLSIVGFADMQPWCQKYCVRNDGLDRLVEMVERVYSTLP